MEIEKGVQNVTELAENLKISNQITHRYIKELLESGFLEKHGSSPKTTYSLNKEHLFSRIINDFDFLKENKLSNYSDKYSKLSLLNISGLTSHDFDFMLKSSALYSSNIEGVSIDLNSFMNKTSLIEKNLQKEVVEVSDLINAYVFAKNKSFNQENFLETHKILTQHILSTSRRGVYRNEKMGVFGTDGLVYLAIEEVLVGGEMIKFFDSVESLMKKKMDFSEVVFWASWVHLSVALVHPFLDGNGRMARLAEKWFIAEKLKDENIWTLQTEHYYFKNRSDYYSSLKLGKNYWDVKLQKSDTFFELLPDFLKKNN